MLCQWLESEADAESYTLAELHGKMVEIAGESEVYTAKRQTEVTGTLLGFHFLLR